jgi:serine/threonine-protein kinase RIO1
VIDLILKETNRYDVVSPDLIFLYASTSGSRNAAAVFFFATKQEKNKAVSQYVLDEKQFKRRNSKINSVG